MWAQFLGGFLVTVLTTTGFYTSAYFFDQERNAQNTLSATKLDGALTGEPFDEKICIVGSDVSTTLTFMNVGALEFGYDMRIGSISGGACSDIEITALLNETEVYTGSLAGLSYPGNDLASGASDVWRIKVRFPSGASTEACTFDTIFSAYQDTFTSGEAFYDTEARTHSVVGVSGGGVGDVTIVNENNATVTNETNARASTGGNTAGGSSGGDGGDGGDISDDGESSEAGDGGDGDDGGSGGTVFSGDASASSTSENVINTNETTVSECCTCDSSCPDEEEGIGERQERPERGTSTRTHIR